MIVERIDLNRIKSTGNINTLESMQVGDSVFFTDSRKAESLRVMSYYLIRTRNLTWKFVFRKMDQGWRVIRTE